MNTIIEKGEISIQKVKDKYPDAVGEYSVFGANIYVNHMMTVIIGTAKNIPTATGNSHVMQRAWINAADKLKDGDM